MNIRSFNGAQVAMTFAFCLILPGQVLAQDQQLVDRAKGAAKVIANLVADPKLSPPSKLLRTSYCVSAIPSVKEAAFIVGGSAGYGLVSCRTAEGWSFPSYMGIKGGSVGLQIGGQGQQVVLLFMDPKAPKAVANTNFQMGGKASVAAGPVGSSISAQSSIKEGTDIYSYSKKGAGAFAGISLNGMNYEVDDEGNRKMYPEGLVPVTKDKSPDVAWLLSHAAAGKEPAGVKVFINTLNERLGPGTLPK